MAEDPTKDPVEDPKDQDPGTDPEDPGTDPEEDPEEEKPKPNPEVQKAIRRRDAALAAKKKAEEEAAALRAKYEPDQADPEVKANRKLVRAEARVVMSGAGLTEREDQAALATFLDLDTVTVGPDGEVDSDEIQERLEKLIRIAGKLSGGQKRTTVPRLDPRDRGGEKGKPVDPATARRKAMLQGR